MRSIEFWKDKLEAAARELVELRPRQVTPPDPPPKRKRFRSSWRRARNRWLHRVKQNKERTFKILKLESRISYYKQRIEALRSLPRAARALRNPPI